MSTEPISDVIGYGVAASRPAAGIAGRLYFPTDVSGTLYRDNGTSWDTISLGGTSVTDYVSGVSGSGQIIIPGVSADFDRKPSSPNAKDDEFDATLAGAWSTINSLDVLNSNTDALSHLHMKKNSSSGLSVYGIYKTAPTAPFTVTAKVTAFARDANFKSAGLLVGDGSPGKFFTIFMPNTTTFDQQATADYAVYTDKDNRASVSEFYALRTMGGWPLYIRLVVTSTTSVTPQISMDGLIWVNIGAAQNPSLSSISCIGLWIAGLANGQSAEAYIDWIRVT